MVCNKVRWQHIKSLHPPVAATNTNQVLNETDFLSQHCCGAQHHSEDNNGMQSGAACSPDSEVKSETFALLFSFLQTGEAVE